MTRSLLYCLCPTGNCFWYCVSTFITCMWRELYVLLFIAYYWWFYNKAFFFVVLLSYFDHLLGWMMKALSPVSMITGCMCAIRRKGTVASLTQPAPQQDSRALLLVVDDCAGDQGQPRLLSDCDSSWQRRDHFTTMSAGWPHAPIVQATMTEHLHTLADRSDPCFSRKLHFIGAEWIYNVVIVSGVKQSDSVTHMCVSGASQVVLVIKDPPANAGDKRDMGSIPGWVRSREK